MDNFETLNEFYGMDTLDEQFVFQNFYIKFEGMKLNGEASWSKILFNKKRIVWKNPLNGIAIAALKDPDIEVKLPNFLPTYDENLKTFKSMWHPLD